MYVSLYVIQFTHTRLDYNKVWKKISYMCSYHIIYNDRCIIGVIAYFVAGILIMKFYKKASGTDIIPNKQFWIKAPFLIKVQFPDQECIKILKDLRNLL